MTIATTGDSPESRARLDSRLHDVAWGLLLTLTGAVWLVPDERIPQGAWLFGVAAVLLGVNIVRNLTHIRINRFSLVLGFMALVAALGRLWRTDLPLLPICLIIIGVSLVAKPLFTKTSHQI